MEKRTNHAQTRRDGQLEERSAGSDFVTGFMTTAGGLTAVGVAQQGKQVVGKIVDKVKPKPTGD
jgi:hypothetical protein